MQITLTITDTSSDVEGVDIPMISLDMKADQSVEGMTEPTPAMWTGSFIYEMFTSGVLIEEVREYIVMKNAQAQQTHDAAVDGS